MKIKDIMTADVITVTSKTKITEVAKVLQGNKFHGVPVVDDGKLVGIVTETDFFTKGENNIYLPAYIEFLKNIKVTGDDDSAKEKNVEKLIGSKAEDIMSRDCVTIHPDSDVETMVALIKEAKLHTVPVVRENGELVGIVTQSDIIKLI